MTRHKSRVARKNRRSTRRGTRKQSGGFGWFGLFGSTPAAPAAQQATPVAAQPATPVAAQPATPDAGDKPGYLSNIINFFKKDTSGKDTSVGPSTPAPHPEGAQDGGRKTRHRRRSARRHHK